jgi:hypothetical protein
MPSRRNYRDQFGPKLLEALIMIIKDEINTLRGKHGLAARTDKQLVDAIKAKLDTLDDYPEV